MFLPTSILMVFEGCKSKSVIQSKEIGIIFAFTGTKNNQEIAFSWHMFMAIALALPPA